MPTKSEPVTRASGRELALEAGDDHGKAHDERGDAERDAEVRETWLGGGGVEDVGDVRHGATI